MMGEFQLQSFRISTPTPEKARLLPQGDYVDSEEDFQRILKQLSSSEKKSPDGQSSNTLDNSIVLVSDTENDSNPASTSKTFLDFRAKIWGTFSQAGVSPEGKKRRTEENAEEAVPAKLKKESKKERSVSNDESKEQKIMEKERKKELKAKEKEEKAKEKELKAAKKAEDKLAQEQKKVERENTQRANNKEKAEKTHVTQVHSDVFVSLRHRIYENEDFSELLNVELMERPDGKPPLNWRKVKDGVPNTITFVRKELKIDKSEQEIECDEVLYVMSVDEFLSAVEGNSLLVIVQSVLDSLGDDRNLTLVVPGLPKYYEELELLKKDKKGKKANSAPNTDGKPIHSCLEEKGIAPVLKEKVEEIMIELMLELGVQEYFPATLANFARDMRAFHRAVAHQKAKEKTISSEGYGIDKEVNKVESGAPLKEAFKGILRQIDGRINDPIASALVEKFLTPRNLWRSMMNDGENELADLEFGNDKGAAQHRTRKIGKALASRIHAAFTTDDPNVLLRQPSKSRAPFAAFQ